MIPWDLHLLPVDRAEEGDTEATTRGVYSNKVFLFGPAAWGGQTFCSREQKVRARLTGFVYSMSGQFLRERHIYFTAEVNSPTPR